LEEWKKVIWSDECSVQIGRDPRKIQVFRKPGEELKEDCLNRSVKSGRVCIMVWASFTAHSVSKLVVLSRSGQRAEEYMETLMEGLIPFIASMFPLPDPETLNIIEPQRFVFMHDNAPCHKPASVQALLGKYHIPVMTWPAQSPDLNPIENLWKDFKARFHKRFIELGLRHSASKEAIKRFGELLKETWESQGLELAQALVKSMPQRVLAVIEAKGGSTKY
jgi:hypothetical protein